MLLPLSNFAIALLRFSAARTSRFPSRDAREHPKNWHKTVNDKGRCCKERLLFGFSHNGPGSPRDEDFYPRGFREGRIPGVGSSLHARRRLFLHTVNREFASRSLNARQTWRAERVSNVGMRDTVREPCACANLSRSSKGAHSIVEHNVSGECFRLIVHSATPGSELVFFRQSFGA